MGKRSNKSKRPKVGTPPHGGREVRIGADPEDWRRERPIWRLRQMVLDGPFGWSKREMGEVLAALAKLDWFGTMTWHDILRTGSHEVTVSEIPNDRVAKELARIGLPDVDTLMSLRLSGAGRLWGVRERRTFTVLWLDPGHDFWPWIPKNT